MTDPDDVGPQEVLDFLGNAFRNIELPELSMADCEDVRFGLQRFLDRHRQNTRATPTLSVNADAVEALRGVESFLADLATADLDELAADGGVTVGMVFQQFAETLHAPRIRAAIAALEPLLRRNQEWQPIETAPLHKRVLATDGETVQECVQKAPGDWESSDAQCHLWSSPTRWQPLPAPPATALETGELKP